ncbi:hypothetical protein JCM9533A_02870 [Catenuloplanes niger JCM 9533]
MYAYARSAAVIPSPYRDLPTTKIKIISRYARRRATRSAEHPHGSSRSGRQRRRADGGTNRGHTVPRPAPLRRKRGPGDDTPAAPRGGRADPAAGRGGPAWRNAVTRRLAGCGGPVWRNAVIRRPAVVAPRGGGPDPAVGRGGPGGDGAACRPAPSQVGVAPPPNVARSEPTRPAARTHRPDARPFRRPVAVAASDLNRG